MDDRVVYDLISTGFFEECKVYLMGHPHKKQEALYFASRYSHNMDFIVWLVRELKADVNVQASSIQLPPLHTAYKRGDVGVADQLIELGANVNLLSNTMSDHASSLPELHALPPLYFALRGGNESTVRRLVDMGADYQLIRRDVGDKFFANTRWCLAYQMRTWHRARCALFAFLCVNHRLGSPLCYDVTLVIGKLVMGSHRDALWKDDARPWISRWKKRAKHDEK